jgi:putative acetyltransferase
MLKLRRSCPEDSERIIEIWRDAVDATHDFLSAEDRIAIDHEVQEMLPKVSLWLAVEEPDRPVAFMGLFGSHMESLFVDPRHHGRGIGSRLVKHARMLHPILTTDVNEQNFKAISFYQRLGFVPTGRSPTDNQGRFYPLVHLEFDPGG